MVWGLPYITSDSRVEGSAKSDFIVKRALTKHLMRGEGVKKGQKLSDVIYGQPHTVLAVKGKKFPPSTVYIPI